MAEEVIGNYRLLKHLMTGQTSQVWEVVEVTSYRHFAMKVLLPEKVSDPVMRRFLLHEADVGKELAHPNIIRIVHVGRDPRNPYFVMEFFPAGNLRLRLQYRKKELAFLMEHAHSVLKQAATGLAFMNAQGWVHRDVKPDNLLINASGDLRIIDFAIAQRIPTGFARMFRRKERAQGTRSYMSPEQIRGLALDARADIYSFGITAYELVTGRPPFTTASNQQELLHKQILEAPMPPMQRNPEVSKEFNDLVMRMLEKKRENRPKDFHEVLIALRSMRVFKNVEPKPSPR
jgi:serine/threonine protein kinase